MAESSGLIYHRQLLIRLGWYLVATPLRSRGTCSQIAMGNAVTTSKDLRCVELDRLAHGALLQLCWTRMLYDTKNILYFLGKV